MAISVNGITNDKKASDINQDKYNSSKHDSYLFVIVSTKQYDIPNRTNIVTIKECKG